MQNSYSRQRVKTLENELKSAVNNGGLSHLKPYHVSAYLDMVNAIPAEDDSKTYERNNSAHTVSFNTFSDETGKYVIKRTARTFCEKIYVYKNGSFVGAKFHRLDGNNNFIGNEKETKKILKSVGYA